ncbi:FAD-dependent oxidoreductase [Blastopirellula sp. J2-11]|uniref:FAD-dependent oxidoreductase n=1 Tax=Blastopirellula sp. J2-11 TaxID=2943192 RepID=UPI0021C81A0E|nr:FAD-dependent oxidoreductase [Blastopirellula sp. J2-11]UUO04519.1 FAD-dependent oxidoreductase [Blastopirellula sp. J2-11]
MHTARCIVVILWLAITSTAASAATVLVEAESFSNLGGWVIDQQAMGQMGSPFILAHGLGQQVADAETEVAFPVAGAYKVWVRTRDWVAPWKKETTPPAMKAVGFPGRFQLSIDGKRLDCTFGIADEQWHWQEGGIVEISEGRRTLAIHDLTGFAGRCDAILFSTDHDFSPPNQDPDMAGFRRKQLGYPDAPPLVGEYDLVVVGGGVAGCCTAISAARNGCRVALLQNRPVLGGNNSSEVRVGLSGLIFQSPYPKLGSVVDEIGPIGHWNLWEAEQNPDSLRSKRILAVIKAHPEKKQHNAGAASNYEDDRKLQAILSEKNIDLFLNTHMNEVMMDGNRIVSVVGQNIKTGERHLFRGRMFVDCTGDGTLGYLAKADLRVGRESKSQTNEALAPEVADKLVMGTSVQWNAEQEEKSSTFPECPWAIQFDSTSCVETTRGDWDWETGAQRDQVSEIERIRDYAFRIVYGNWATLKNDEKYREKYAPWKLSWIAYIGGKRESRRLLGDIILRQQDIVEQKEFPDACVTTTWTIDLHYPLKPICACEAFQSEAHHLQIEPYPIPYRCLYSRNIDNLFMAGRNISVTHIALGTVRVQRTTGMMGEVVGMAAGICKKHACNPRDVYEDHLPELKEQLNAGVPQASSAAPLRSRISP